MPFLPTRKNYSNAFVVGGGGERGNRWGGVCVCMWGRGETRAKQTGGSAKVNIITCDIEPVKTETLP